MLGIRLIRESTLLNIYWSHTTPMYPKLQGPCRGTPFRPKVHFIRPKVHFFCRRVQFSNHNFPQKRHWFIAQNQNIPRNRHWFMHCTNPKFSPEKALVHYTKPKIFPRKKPTFLQLGKMWNLISRCQENAY
jgi:hypothetical protein